MGQSGQSEGIVPSDTDEKIFDASLLQEEYPGAGLDVMQRQLSYLASYKL
jgi:hypothetical protein